MSEEMLLLELNELSGNYDEYYTNWFDCPNCKNNRIAEDSNYCSDCGMKIKWIRRQLKMDQEAIKND